MIDFDELEDAETAGGDELRLLQVSVFFQKASRGGEGGFISTSFGEAAVLLQSSHVSAHISSVGDISLSVSKAIAAKFRTKTDLMEFHYQKRLAI